VSQGNETVLTFSTSFFPPLAVNCEEEGKWPAFIAGASEGKRLDLEARAH